MTDLAVAQARFAERFGRRPTVVVRAPGRVNLIGEHTDHAEGWVLPFAIESAVWVAAAPSHQSITAYSQAMDQTIEWPIDRPFTSTHRHWARYVGGMIAELGHEGIPVTGASLWIGGDLPIGRGLASSAALCVAVGEALAGLHRPACPHPRLESDGAAIRLTAAMRVQRVERDHAGTPCGLMDPYVCLLGRADHALLLDCRAMTHELVPMTLPDARWMVIDTGVIHEHSTGAYARRVAECRAAAESIARACPGVRSLRDVTSAMLEEHVGVLDPILARRARHVVAENHRVHQTAAALRNGEAERLGDGLRGAHRSLRDLFEVSTPEIDQLVDYLSAIPGVHGARLIGGGFGGSLLALVDKRRATDLRTMLLRLPGRSRMSDGGVLEVRSADGAATWPMG